MKKTPKRRSADVTMSRLEQTPHVVHACAAVNSWPLAGAAAFLEQAKSDSEISDVTKVTDAALAAAIEHVAMRNPEDGERLRGLALALDAAGEYGSNLLATYTLALLVHGVLYGMRLANYAAGAR